METDGEPDFVAPASGATRAVIAQIEAQKETLAKTKTEIDERQDLHDGCARARALILQARDYAR